ncbi:MAG: NAD-dependent deacylase [Thermoguttaceae bacterium]|nr:NAD-dependent deacylase [Thermoguttaceae bacterium]
MPAELDFDAKIRRFAELLADAPKIAALTGAGISTESGIPDFRSSTGVYQTTSEAVFSIDFFRENPGEFYRIFGPFYAQTVAAAPNAGHVALADLERLGKKVEIVTQNIDALHSAAGSTFVWEIHGTLRTSSCVLCDRSFEPSVFGATVATGQIPRCPECGGDLKPDIVFFGEALPERALAGAQRAMWETRLLLVLGTSLQVYPAAGLPRECDADVPFVVVNQTPTPLDRFATLVFRESIGDVLPRAVELAATLVKKRS